MVRLMRIYKKKNRFARRTSETNETRKIPLGHVTTNTYGVYLCTIALVVTVKRGPKTFAVLDTKTRREQSGLKKKYKQSLIRTSTSRETSAAIKKRPRVTIMVGSCTRGRSTARNDWRTHINGRNTGRPEQPRNSYILGNLKKDAAV